MSEPIKNNFNGGLNKDVAPNLLSEGSYFHAKNAVNNTHEGNMYTLSTEAAKLIGSGLATISLAGAGTGTPDTSSTAADTASAALPINIVLTRSAVGLDRGWVLEIAIAAR